MVLEVVCIFTSLVPLENVSVLVTRLLKVEVIKGYLEDWMYCKKPGENIKDVGKCIDMMERYLIPAFKVN